MTRSNPNFDQLLAYVTGELPRAEHAGIEAHLAGSAEATATVARIRTMLMTMQADRGETPSAAAIAKAKAIFQTASADSSTSWSWIDRLQQAVASLTYDSRVEPALAGFRGENDGFELTFESDAGGIELQLEPENTGPKWRMMGQVTPAASPAPEIEIALVPPGAQAAVVQAAADEHGMFSLTASPGTYDLLVRVGSNVVRVPQLQIA